MKVHGFTHVRKVPLPELGGYLHELEHDRTGARLVWLERPDENKTFCVAFPTQPENSTGVFHILEHSVLCGSENYPAKEPFVELMKSSMNTFINAFTFPDKTMYPVSSRNDKDFLNLTRVYMDAVFRPMIYRKPEIFCQEGWHYELDGEGNVSYKGVVFNEMKGACAGAGEQMIQTMNSMLYPDNCYRFNSGGDPAVIPDLTYEMFLDAHRRFYSPTNALFYLDGALDLEAVLSIIDGEYLADLPRGQRTALPEFQKPVDAGLREVAYEIGREENSERKYRFGWANIAGTCHDRERIVALQVLIQTLCQDNQSPLCRCLLEKGLAENVTIQLREGLLQPWVLLEVENFARENLEEIEATLRQTMDNLIQKGIDKNQLEARLSNMELKLRERDYGPIPRGLMLGLQVYESWLYGGAPEAKLQVGDLFVSLREKMAAGYFEELLEQVLLRNPHTCRILLRPDADVGEVRRGQEQARLERESAGWTAEKRGELAALQARLHAWQETPDTRETLDKLPRLTLADLPREPEKIPTEIRERGEITLLLHDIPCGGIVYAEAHFDISHLTEDELSAAGLLCALLGRVDTETLDSRELASLRQKLCGDFACEVRTFPRPGNRTDCRTHLVVSFSALEENLSRAAELVAGILTGSRFRQEAVVEILRQKRTELAQYCIMAGSYLAMDRVEAQYTAAGVARECSKGYRFFSWLGKMEEDPRLTEILRSTAGTIFRRQGLHLSVTGTWTQAPECLISALGKLPLGGETAARRLTPWGKRREGIAIPADISFAVRGGCLESGCDGITPLAAQAGGLDFLWNAIRVQGGAYGTGINAGLSGFLCCHSYRDPSPHRSLGIYTQVADHLRGICAEKRDLTGLIIGTVASQSPVRTGRMLGMEGDNRYFCGLTEEILSADRAQLLACGHVDLRLAAADLEKTIADGGICVVGPEQKLQLCGLDEILTL